MNSSKKIIFVFILFSLTQIFAQTKFVKYGNEFLSIGVGGKSLGMGSVSVFNRDVTSAYWNPAGLSFIDYPEFILQHDERFGNLLNFDYGAVAIPNDSDMTLGFSVIRLGIDGIPDTRNALIDQDGNGNLDKYDRLDYSKVTYHNAADWAFLFSYAKKYNENISYGGNLKIIYRSLIDHSAFGIGFDIAGIYSPFEKLFLGLNIQDITTTLLAWDTGLKELVPPIAKFGVGYQIDLYDGVLSPAMDFDFRFDGTRSSSTFNIGSISSEMHFGLDYTYKKFLSARIGFNEVKQLTLGLGLKISKLNIDYAFAKFGSENDLGNTHRISLMFTLENELFKR